MKEKIKKIDSYIKAYGIRKTVGLLYEKATHKDQKDYERWLERHKITETIREAQKETVFNKQPCFSIVVPLYKTQEKYLKELLESIKGQTYSNWELCLSDGSGLDSPLKEVLKELEYSDSRIKVISSKEPLKIAENTNAAIEIATGDYIVFADHDDILSIDALYECAKCINENSKVDMIYSDEDKVSMDGQTYFEPHFKPDLNMDLLCSVNYFCHLVVVKRQLLEQAGKLNGEYNGAQDYDFVLRCVENTDAVYHIPKILYHWRAHMDSTAENPESKRYAFEAGRRAIQKHYERIGLKDAYVEETAYPGTYRTRYKYADKPKVSIIIDEITKKELLGKTLQSIKANDYPDYEVIIVDCTEKKEIEKFVEKYQDKRIRVKRGEKIWTAAKRKNEGAGCAEGEYLIFLAGNAEYADKEGISELVSVAMRSDVGVVGTRSYYKNGTVEHAGCVIGMNGTAGSLFEHTLRGENGYFSHIVTQMQYSAVAGACMMVKKDIFEKVNGFDEDYKGELGKVDLCLKIRNKHMSVVYNPYVKVMRWSNELRNNENDEKLFKKQWAEILEKDDPYYNKNLSLSVSGCNIR
ncbi:glycosyltransferase [Dorea longicatena]|uniref:Hyaluronan synthase n=1 Tax=Dorea longicatena TaxID=88431 RepID=A0A174CJX6_9FIRM|nr:glycosyltransferase [Dorea longicatena]NSE43966.1 glycosyltransferase [Dorea longicatena]CUO12489.1 Hyaluronan synthase [Dorea longicatena]